MPADPLCCIVMFLMTFALLNQHGKLLNWDKPYWTSMEGWWTETNLSCYCLTQSCLWGLQVADFPCNIMLWSWWHFILLASIVQIPLCYNVMTLITFTFIRPAMGVFFPNWRNSVQISTLLMIGHALWITNLNTLQTHLPRWSSGIVLAS